jgi:hypothetical protein
MNASAVRPRNSGSCIGMTREIMLCAFDPFFTAKCQGLGGSVAMESTLGPGTTVILRLLDTAAASVASLFETMAVTSEIFHQASQHATETIPP